MSVKNAADPHLYLKRSLTECFSFIPPITRKYCRVYQHYSGSFRFYWGHERNLQLCCCSVSLLFMYMACGRSNEDDAAVKGAAFYS